MGCDMICGLAHLPKRKELDGIAIKRVFASDRNRVLAFIREHFSENWAQEAEIAILQLPSTCFIAVEDGKILGFACYDATAKGFFGPTGLKPEARGRGIGSALLLRTLEAMWEVGYAYAVIGWVGGAESFYRKVVGAEFIKGGEPENSIYSQRIDL